MRSMRGSTSAVNGFPLIFRVIFRFISTQPLVWGAVYDGDEYFGKMQGGGGGALRAPVLGAGFWVLAPVVRDWADLCGVVRRGRDSGRMQNWTNKAVIVGIKGVGVRRRLGLAGLAWMRTSPLGVGDAVWSRFLVATNGKRPGPLRGPAVEMRMGATRRLQRPRLSLVPGLLGCAGKHFSADQSQFPVGHLVSWCPRHFGMSDRISRGFSEDAFRTVLR